VSAAHPLASVVILGGGFTGAAVAYHLASRHGACDIVVIEPRDLLGGGLAYSATEPTHRINVPATKMSLRPAEPEHFAHWLAASGELDRDPDAVTAKGDAFPQRRVFGRYVAAHLAPLIADGRVRHVRAAAIGAEPVTGGYRIALADGSSIVGRVLVLAMTHTVPGIPAPLRQLAASGCLVSDPYAPDALAAIEPNARLAIIGTGLTGADLVAALEAHGHTGPITLVSRHGLVSGRHAQGVHDPRGDFSTAPHASALNLLRQVRRELAASAAAGQGWQPVFDALRNQGQAIWSALDAPARRQLLRHLRSYWDVHRFRIAPQVAASWDRLIGSGRGTLRAARIAAADVTPDGIVLALKPRFSREETRVTVDRVLLATGPEHGRVLEANPALAGLAAAGLLSADPYRLGIHASRTGRAIGQGGSSGYLHCRATGTWQFRRTHGPAGGVALCRFHCARNRRRRPAQPLRQSLSTCPPMFGTNCQTLPSKRHEGAFIQVC
jgi:uncharacterized NAD(P)/FAD-binding protein YdhS